jgi:hypothetical protein
MIKSPLEKNYTLQNPIERTERKWLLIFACLVMLITTIPYIQAYAVERDVYRFTGFFFGVQDGNSYIAKMLSGTYGSWLFRTPYTIQSQDGVLMYLPYILLGKLASSPGLHIQLVMLFHFFRFAAGILMIMASYDFLAYFVREFALRRIGIVLISLGGGLGWILLLLGQEEFFGSFPLEFYSPESFGFLSLLGLPHLSFARAFMLWALLIYLRRLPVNQAAINRYKKAFQMGLLWLCAGIMQPLTLFVIGVVLLMHLLGLLIRHIKLSNKQKQSSWQYIYSLIKFDLIAGLLPGLLLIYYTLSTLMDPFLADWSAQNNLPSPNPLHYLLAYGLTFPLIWIGGKIILSKKPEEGWFLVGWVILFPFLAYFPSNIQRRLPDGIWVVLIVLLLIAIQGWCDKSKPFSFRHRLALIFYLIFFFPSTLMFYWGGLKATHNPQEPLFRLAEEVDLFEFLQSNTKPGEVVLTSFESGNALPAWAPVRVIIGHGPESVHLERYLPYVEQFYQSNTSDLQRLEWLNDWDLDYVFYGPNERKLGDWNPKTWQRLRLLHQSGEYQLFEVLP